ncbi:hypothetical protein QUB16_27870 [Microcoleus sp. D3_18a_C4]
MPVPQPNSSLVEQASCLFLKMVQDVSKKNLIHQTGTHCCINSPLLPGAS